MKYKTLIYPVLTISLTSCAYARNRQRPLNPQNLLPTMPSETSPSTSAPADDSTVLVSDVIGNDRSINIFAGFTRDFAPISQRFEDSSLNTTILAPINSAIMHLPRKPWEDAEEYDELGTEAYEGGEGEERAQSNLRTFVEAHVVPASPWKEGEKVKTLNGGEIYWEEKDGNKIVSLNCESEGDLANMLQIQPGNIEVSSVASKVYNGEVWILKGVRNYVREREAKGEKEKGENSKEEKKKE